jgi:hypothetical protein
MTEYTIKDEGDLRKYYCQIPNMIDDMNLNPYAFRLYVHLKRVTGASQERECSESLTTMTKICKMSRPSIVQAKRDLCAAGLIEIREVSCPGGKAHHISIKNIWVENINKYSGRPDKQNEATLPLETQESTTLPPAVNYATPRGSHVALSNNSLKTNKKDGVLSKEDKTRVPDPRSKHPAILMVKGITGKYPNKTLWDDIIKQVGDHPDGEKAAACYKAWVTKGYNASALTWLTDWYKTGIPKYNGSNAPARRQATDADGNILEVT